MIAGPESTAETMLKALATTLGGLDAATDLDVDRTPEDRKFFADERDALQKVFDKLAAASAAATQHTLLVAMRAQARVVVGDAVLDRGVSRGKERMKLELKGSAMEDGADHVFGVDVTVITRTERAKEPNVVLKAVARFADVPDFPGKAQMEGDLSARAAQQQQCFVDRDAAGVTGAGLDSAVDVSSRGGSDALYGLEKRLLDRFKRDTTYVKAFFLDVGGKKKAEATPPAPTPAAPAAPPAATGP